MTAVTAIDGAAAVRAAQELEGSGDPLQARAPVSSPGGNTVERYADASTLARAGVRLHEVYADSRVHVLSDDPTLTGKTGRDLAHKVERFYDWDAKQQAWADTRPLEAPLTVAALSRPAFAALTGDSSGSIGGFTTGPNLFVVPKDSAQRNGPEDDMVVAHELGHVQDFREAKAGLGQLPIYLQEGKEYLLGDAAAMQGHRVPKNVYDVSRALGHVTAADAKLVMTDFREPRDEQAWGHYGFYGETIGALYVEFLRLHFKSGTPDALQKVAEVTEKVGQGKSYETAFGEAFHATPRQAEDAFVKWVGATEGRPFERLKGTLYDPAKLVPESALEAIG